MLFPRWTGPDGNPPMLMAKHSLLNYINVNNGKRQCTVSIYAFEVFRNHKPNVSTAMIDTLYVRGDPEKMMGHMGNLDLNRVYYNAYYDGKEILILAPLGLVADSIRTEAINAYKRTDVPFITRTWDIMLWPGTWNPKTKSYVIEVKTDDELGDLPEMACKPIKRPKATGIPIRRLYSG